MRNDPLPSRHVLVTGAAGAIGRPVCAELTRRGHRVRALDIRPVPDVPDAVVADVADAGAVDAAVDGVDCVLHLGAYPDEADFMSELLGPNVVGVYNVCDAARRHGVKRLVLTSSGQVIQAKPWRQRMIRLDETLEPLGHYAATKAFAEAMAFVYAHKHGMSVIVVRPDSFPREASHVADLEQDERTAAIYLSPGDAGRFYAACVEAPNVSYAVLFATSRAKGPMAFDVEPAKQVIGYEPKDTWPEGCPKF